MQTFNKQHNEIYYYMYMKFGYWFDNLWITYPSRFLKNNFQKTIKNICIYQNLLPLRSYYFFVNI